MSAIHGNAACQLDISAGEGIAISRVECAKRCLRIALHRPPGSDRDEMVRLTARMLAAVLTAPTSGGR